MSNATPRNRFKASERKANIANQILKDPVRLQRTSARYERVEFDSVADKLAYISKEWMFEPQLKFSENDSFVCSCCSSTFPVSECIIEKDDMSSDPNYLWVGCCGCTASLISLSIKE